MEFEELLELSIKHKKRHTKGILATKEKEKREYREVLKQGAGRRNYIKQKKIEMGYIVLGIYLRQYLKVK